MRILAFVWGVLAALSFSACDHNPVTPSEPKLRVKLSFNTTQQRLDNLGQPTGIPAGHAAQTPDFHRMCVHYVELAPTIYTQIGGGNVIYHAPETTAGGANAINFSQAIVAPADSVFLEIPLSSITPGTYSWVRASVAYQNYDIRFNLRNLPIIGSLMNQRGTVAAFVGFNTYIERFKLRSQYVTVNDDKLQGYWAFETNLDPPYNQAPYTQYYSSVLSGQAPAGATTVVNPLFATSPIPAGSCLVTGEFAQPLVITGNETADKTVTLSFSVNQSFEWTDADGNGTFDFYYTGTGNSDVPVDMGLRGLIAYPN